MRDIRGLYALKVENEARSCRPPSSPFPPSSACESEAIHGVSSCAAFLLEPCSCLCFSGPGTFDTDDGEAIACGSLASFPSRGGEDTTSFSAAPALPMGDTAAEEDVVSTIGEHLGAAGEAEGERAISITSPASVVMQS